MAGGCVCVCMCVCVCVCARARVRARVCVCMCVSCIMQFLHSVRTVVAAAIIDPMSVVCETDRCTRKVCVNSVKASSCARLRVCSRQLTASKYINSFVVMATWNTSKNVI